MPITQNSWLTNLTENDLTEQLSDQLDNILLLLQSNNNNIDELMEDNLTAVKNSLATIDTKVSSIVNSNTGSLIGATEDGYGTTTSGTVMGKLNYLIYLLAPTPTTFNYTSAGTFNNITIPTGVKFISVTACGGCGGGGKGASFNEQTGSFLNAVVSNCFNTSAAYNLTNTQSYGRRMNYTHISWTNNSGSDCTGNWISNNRRVYGALSIAKNIVCPGGNAGVTSTVVTGTKNVSLSEVITVVVGAAGAAYKAGGASTVSCGNGTISASGGTAGANGGSLTYSNWTVVGNERYWLNKTIYPAGENTNIFQPYHNGYITNAMSVANFTITVTSQAGKTASANSLGRKGGAGGAGASGSFTWNRTNNYYAYFNGTRAGSGAAGSAGQVGYVRVGW